MAAMLLADMGATVLRIDRTTVADLGIPMDEDHDSPAAAERCCVST